MFITHFKQLIAKFKHTPFVIGINTAYKTLISYVFVYIIAKNFIKIHSECLPFIQ
jgi:hypothetical protein